MKKLFIALLILGLALPCFAQEKIKVFPERGILSFRGLDDTSAPTIIEDGRAADMQNIILNNDGSASKRYGYSLKNVSLDTNDAVDAFEAVTSLYELVTSNASRYFIVTCGSKIFKDNGLGGWTNVTGPVTITEGANYQFVWTTAFDYAIGTNDVDVPIKYGGGVNADPLDVSDLSDTLTKAKAVTWWKNYLILGNTVEGGIERPTRIRWSAVGTIETFDDDDFVDIAALGGQEIEGFGILYDNLYIFLTDSIYKVSLVGGDELLVITKIADKIGCIAKNSIQTINVGNKEGIVFLSRDKTINFCDGVNIVDISGLISSTMDELLATRLPYAVSVNDVSTSHYYLAVSYSDSATYNNLLLDFYYDLGEWSKHSNIYANALCVANDSSSIPQIYFGNYKSFVYLMQDTTLYSDVYGITGTFDDADLIDTTTASQYRVLYDTALNNNQSVSTNQYLFLCHADGSAGSTAFTDLLKHNITAYGDSQKDTAQKKFGTSSAVFDGGLDYLVVDDSADWDFSTGDFTIDCWVRLNTKPSAFFVFDVGAAETGTGKGVALYYSANQWIVTVNDTTRITVANPDLLSLNTWHHLAVVRNSGTLTFYVDGTIIGSTTSSDNITGSTEGITIGSWSARNQSFLDGWVDEFRISSIAEWATGFTVETAAYPNFGFAGTAVGGMFRILSGSGLDEELTVYDTTATGFVVDASTAATGDSVYIMGDIDSYITTKWYDCGNPSLRKNWGDLFLWFGRKNTTTMDILWATDEDETINELTASQYNVDSIWGETITATPAWAGDEFSFAKVPLNASGRFIKVKFREEEIDESMDLTGYSIVYWDLDVY